jgi:hypothetical protein
MRLRKHLPLTLLCAALLFAAAPPSAAQSGAWRLYQPPSKIFTAEFPGVPVYETKPVDYGPYKSTAHRHWLAQPGRDGGRFEVVHMQTGPDDGSIPPSVILDATIDTLLSQYRDRGLRETARREVIVKGCVGREFEAVDSAGVTLRGRMFVAGDQIVNAIYVGPASSAARQQDARRFLDSVTLVETCAPPPAEPPAAEVKKLGKLSGTLDAASGWRLIAPGQSEFSVLMPTAAEAEEEVAQEKPFPLITRSYVAEDAEAIFVAVECGDFPEEMSRLSNFEQLKANLGYRALLAQFEPAGVKVAAEGSVRVSGYEGQQYRLTAEDATGRALVISSPRKFYFFAAIASGRTPPAAKFDRFFSSLKITRP